MAGTNGSTKTGSNTPRRSSGKGGGGKAPAGLTYAGAGVDIDAGDRAVERFEAAVRRTHGPRVISRHGAFAGMFRLDYNERLFRRNYRDPVLVACTDGVGTKVKLAAEMGRFETIGIDCVAMNVNDLIVQGAEPLFFLDYLGLHRQDPEETAALVASVARGCELADCALLGGECAEMPDVYAEGDFDIAGFAVGVVELGRAIDATRVEKGDVILGLGAAGVHSNGFTLVRKILKRGRTRLDRPMPELAEGLVRGTDLVAAGAEPTLGEIMLEPTRIYVRSVVELLRSYRVKKVVSGMAHITGGGLPGNVNRALHDQVDAVIDAKAWTVPPLFDWLAAKGGVERGEMERVFNLGIGYVLIVRPSFAEAAARRLRKAGEQVHVLGEVVKGSGQVRIRH